MSLALSTSHTDRSIAERGIQTYPDPENVGRSERQMLAKQAVEDAKAKAEIYANGMVEIFRIKAEADEAMRRANRAISKLKNLTGTIDQIIARICRVTGVSKKQIIGSTRRRHVVFARMAICYWARRTTGLSLPHIAKRLGGRDHTTILHSVRAYPKRRAAMNRHLREI